MGEYTVLALAAPVAVIALELLVLRTGLLRQVRYWITVAIVFAFMVPVDGWLTKPEGTVVHYDPAGKSGIRAPWNIPVEDFGFGFAMITLTLLMWLWWQRRDQRSGRLPPRRRAHRMPRTAGGERSGEMSHA
jgi:lycopene cyclase domain-containing protein